MSDIASRKPESFIDFRDDSDLPIRPTLAKSNSVMPIATPAQYRAMLDAAQKGGYAYPAVNVTSITTINGALRAFSEAKCDGIIQVSTGGGEFASGTLVKNAAFGAIILAEAAHLLAEKHDVLIGLHTDHCQPGKVDSFLRPLLEASKKRIAEGKGPLFQSHMLDASELPLEENLTLSKALLKECADLGIILEVEAGVVGGEEDGHDTSGVAAEKLYTTPEDMLAVYEALQPIGRFLFAATFGNVHGAYKPGAVKLLPTILRDGQKVVTDKHGPTAEMDLVFHGGSGSDLSDIRETLDYGVVKMNIDTDTQYAFTRPIVTHICQNLEGVLKIDGEVGDKKQYDPRSYLKKAEISLANRLKEAADDLRATGRTIFGTV
ncbi:MAG: class II fructose-bisphosphate aldolase [Akkermansiaceae bacterium]|nr:class II fructose-bisphosphate aldolase [Akkermansiaceae bacterium]